MIDEVTSLWSLQCIEASDLSHIRCIHQWLMHYACMPWLHYECSIHNSCMHFWLTNAICMTDGWGMQASRASLMHECMHAFMTASVRQLFMHIYMHTWLAYIHAYMSCIVMLVWLMHAFGTMYAWPYLHMMLSWH